MSNNPCKPAPLPTKAQILEFIQESPGTVGKRDISRAFRLTAEQRPLLRDIMKSLEEEGSLQRGHKRRVHRPGHLPNVAVLEITAVDADGDLWARPMNWPPEDQPTNLPSPRVLVEPVRKGLPAVGIGDKILARLHPTGNHTYSGRVMKRLTSVPSQVLGVLENGVNGLLLRPTDKRDRRDYGVAHGDAGTAKVGDLVVCDLLAGRRFGLRRATVRETLGSMGHPKAVSLIALHSLDIPHVFSSAALAQAAEATVAPMGPRVDLRGIPLLTIDGSDARDFDDAVWAEADGKGGWHCLVAIADVAHYVRTGDALDQTAAARGNSVYFPDRVVPMLPEALSNGWCSLRPNEDRPCLAVHFWIDANGDKYKHAFVRGMMRSTARLTYEQMQAAMDGIPDDITRPLQDSVIQPLHEAYRALRASRCRRGALDIDLPERRILVGENGQVSAIVPCPSLDAHKLIEDFMVAANVCAAETLDTLRQPCLYRVHDEPSPERVESLRDVLKSMGLTIAHGALRPQNFNAILAKVKDTPQDHLVNQSILRAQAQAVYSPQNQGHFGLGLGRYTHFTSPIRRYGDLLVHRALIRGLGLGDGGLSDAQAREFDDLAEHISMTERRAATAERDVIDRYAALYLSDRVGATFGARISGATRFGLFIDLEETGANGLVPMSSLPDDFYAHDERRHALVGRKTRREFQVGQRVGVILRQADPITGGMLFDLIADTVDEKSRRGGESGPAQGKSTEGMSADGPRKHFTPLRVGRVKRNGVNTMTRQKRAGKKRVFVPGGRKKT